MRTCISVERFFAASAWCRSPHNTKVDIAHNETVEIIAGSSRPTPTVDLLQVLSGIASVKQRWNNLTNQLVQRAPADEINS